MYIICRMTAQNATKQQTSLADIDIGQLRGVGPRMRERFSKLGVETVQDLLFHLPYRYQDRTRITPIRSLRDSQYAVIEGSIITREIKYGKRRSLVCYLQDATAAVALRFYHFTQAQVDGLKPGVKLRCFGEARLRFKGLEITHPEYRRQQDDGPSAAVEETLTPIYPSTEGISQGQWRKLTDQVLATIRNHRLQELLPETIQQQFQLSSLRDAILYVHRPPPDANLDLLFEGRHPAQQRLAFEELVAQQLSLRRLRQQLQQRSAPALNNASQLKDQFLQELGFQLTGAQCRVSEEINGDLAKEQPMQRLVQGDVGAGKTVIAALAALQAIESGFQVALMAPTEILAEQHFLNFEKWLSALNIKTAFLSGTLKAKQKREMLAAIETGEAKMVVGTHALLQDTVEFQKLGLVIIDEQHRFGVEQRFVLHDKGRHKDVHPHQLIMTATPIPRTLAMTAYADLDLSIIDELPPGRTPINTVAIANDRRLQVIDRIRAACQEKKQAYWVCTLIEESESLQCQAAEITAQQLAEALPEQKIALVHGRIKSEEKQRLMHEFKAGNIDLLVATTVIEVGVDVPNASLIVIENPERLGLAQLHQLRGRVGRGTVASHCVLLYQAPLTDNAFQRINVMRESNDGFVIARKDLQIRGAGELLGTRQTGIAQLRIADIIRDSALIPKAQAAADRLLADYPDTVPHVLKRWLHDSEKYALV